MRKQLAVQAIFSAFAVLGWPANAYAGIIGSLINEYIQDKYVITRAAPPKAYYNYAPDVIYDNGAYHMYWCAGVGAKGDYILHAQSSSVSGPYHASNNAAPNSYDVAFHPTWSKANFDGYETCDPSVVKYQGVYYLYYGGLATQVFGTAPTMIGVASGTDGINFSRLNGGKPIVTPARNFATSVNKYGAGQPAVIYIEPYFYMSFTDTTGPGDDANGNGQFAIRAIDPLFQNGLQELTASGWVARAPGTHTAEYSYINAVSIDLSYDVMTGKIVLASEYNTSQSAFFVLDPANFSILGSMLINGGWHDGPSLAKQADRTMLSRLTCNTADLAIFKGESAKPNDPVPYWNIAMSEGTFDLTPLCSSLPVQPKGFFKTSGAPVPGGLYYSNGVNGYCWISTMDNFLNMGGTSANVSSRAAGPSGMAYNGICPLVPEPKGFFKTTGAPVPGGLYYSDGASSYCWIASMADFYAMGGNPADIAPRTSGPAGMVFSGTCATPPTSCQITQAVCPNFPTAAGSFKDNVLNAGSNQAECMQRSVDYYNWCGIQPSSGQTTTAAYLFGVESLQTQSIGPTACQISLASCPNAVTMTGTFVDNVNNASFSQAACMQRATDFYKSCGIKEASMQTVTAKYFSSKIVLESKTVGVSCAGKWVGDACWYLDPTANGGQSCNTICAGHGGYSPATETYAGTKGGNLLNCVSVLSNLGITSGGTPQANACGKAGIGCAASSEHWAKVPPKQNVAIDLFCNGAATGASAGKLHFLRACACNQ